MRGGRTRWLAAVALAAAAACGGGSRPGGPGGGDAGPRDPTPSAGASSEPTDPAGGPPGSAGDRPVGDPGAEGAAPGGGPGGGTSTAGGATGSPGGAAPGATGGPGAAGGAPDPTAAGGSGDAGGGAGTDPGGAAGAGAPSARCAPGRATADRPDDLDDAYQIHAVYALPDDGRDEELDVRGAIATSVAAWNGWLAARTGGRRLRLDTCDGQLDVTFFRLPEHEEEVARLEIVARNAIEEALVRAGFDAPKKIYAVYYGGRVDGAHCGGAAWPPSLPGTVAAMFVAGSTCRLPLTDSESSPGYWELAMLHDLLHVQGLVGTCAPHGDGAHVTDSPQDLMYTGPEPWRPAEVDVGRDDYFEHGRPECPDLARSVWLEPAAPDAVPPPGWPRPRASAAGAGAPLTAPGPAAPAPGP
jgi:hypothetical protein